jgi:hypothetical protein
LRLLRARARLSRWIGRRRIGRRWIG